MSVLIKYGEPIARTSAVLKSGAIVRAAYKTVPEAIDANRTENLLSAFDVKASNAKKWDADEYVSLPIAVGINGEEEEFLISEG